MNPAALFLLLKLPPQAVHRYCRSRARAVHTCRGGQWWWGGVREPKGSNCCSFVSLTIFCLCQERERKVCDRLLKPRMLTVHFKNSFSVMVLLQSRTAMFLSPFFKLLLKLCLLFLYMYSVCMQCVGFYIFREVCTFKIAVSLYNFAQLSHYLVCGFSNPHCLIMRTRGRHEAVR